MGLRTAFRANYAWRGILFSYSEPFTCNKFSRGAIVFKVFWLSVRMINLKFSNRMSIFKIPL